MIGIICIYLFTTTEEFKVKKIEFHGNKTFNDKKLKTLIFTKEGKIYNEFQVTMDKKRIENFYHNHGFKEAKVEEWKRTILDFKKKIIRCDVYIIEGKQEYVRKITIQGNKVFKKGTLLKEIKLKENSPLNYSLIFLSKCRVAKFYATHGYPYAEIQDSVKIIKEDSLIKNVELIFIIQEKHCTYFGEIKIKGLEKVRKEIVEREIKIKKGEIYSPSKLYYSQSKIYATELFEEVEFELEGIKEEKDTVNVIFKLKETSPRWISWGVGYTTPDYTWVTTGWGHSNLWNNGQKLEMKIKYEFYPFDMKKLQKIEINVPYREPYFLDTPLKAELLGFYKLYFQNKEEEKYKFQYIGIQGRIGWFVGKYGKIFVSYNYEIPKEEGKKFELEENVNSVTFSFSYDTRNDPFYPTIGGMVGGNYEYGEMVRRGIKFGKFVTEGSIIARYFHTTMAIRLKIGGIHFGETALNKKFILGGGDVIRGYVDMSYENIQEVAKNWIGIFNFEFRIPVWRKIEIAYFMDTGNIWEEKINLKEIKIGIGFGIRYKFPIGAIRLDYGKGLTEIEEKDKGRVHIGIGYLF